MMLGRVTGAASAYAGFAPVRLCSPCLSPLAPLNLVPNRRMAVASWNKLPPLPKKESGHATLYLPHTNQIALLGKQHLVKDAADDAAAWTPVTVNDSTFRKALPKTVKGAAALDEGKRMVVMGKTLLMEHTAVIDIDETGTTWNVAKADGLRPILSDYSLTEADNYLYLVGTEFLEEINRNPSSLVYCSSDELEEGWEETDEEVLGIGPTSKSISAFAYNNEVVCLSKPEDNTYMRVHIINPETNEWREIKGSGDAPSGLTKYSACLVGDNLVVYGGLIFETNVLLRTVNTNIYNLDLKTYVWSKVDQEDAPEGRHSHSAVMDPHGRMIVTGGASETGTYDEVYALSIDYSS